MQGPGLCFMVDNWNVDPTLRGLPCGYKLFLKYGDLSFPSSQQFQPCHPDSCSNLVYRPFSLFSHSVMSNSLQPHGLQHTRPPCPSPTPGAYSNSCPLSRWCHPTISPSVIPFSSCLQSFPASDLFQSVSSWHQVARVLELQLQHQSFHWIFRVDFL